MSRHFCNHNKESFLCIAESRGDNPNCDKCPMNEDLEDSPIVKETKMINKIKNIYEDGIGDSKIIGREIECDCGCGRFLRVFDDMEYGRVEVVMQTECSQPTSDRWKKSFIITKDNLKRLIDDAVYTDQDCEGGDE